MPIKYGKMEVFMEMEKFEGTLFISKIYKNFDVHYILTDKEDFFRVSAAEFGKIPDKKKVPKTPINFGWDYIKIEDGQRVTFECEKEKKGKYRWAKKIKPIGLGELFS